MLGILEDVRAGSIEGDPTGKRGVGNLSRMQGQGLESIGLRAHWISFRVLGERPAKERDEPRKNGRPA